MIFSEANAAVELFARLRNWLCPLSREPATLAERFLQVFEAHGVHRNQIPRFFGRGITLKDVQSADRLFEALTEDALRGVCELFAINRSWLDGAACEIYPIHRCYKQPKKFRKALDQLIDGGNTLNGWVLVGARGKRAKYEVYDATLIIGEEIGWVEDKPIHRFHLWDQWIFDYWKCRAYLAACVAYCWKRDVPIFGLYGDRKKINRITKGKAFLPRDDTGGGMSLVGPRWHPEDMVTLPEVFLSGIAKRDGSVGEKLGLKLWLDLEAEGWMRSSAERSRRKEFQRMLEKAEA